MLSTYLNSKLDIAKKLVSELLEKYQYVSLLGKHISGKRIRVSNFVTNLGDSIENQCGFVIKVLNNGVYSEYSFTDLSLDNYDHIIKVVDEELKLSKNILSQKMTLSLLLDEPLKQDFYRPSEGKEINPETAVQLLNEIKDIMVNHDKRIVQAIANHEHYTVSSFFISKNRELSQSFSWSSVSLVSVAREGDAIKDTYNVSASNNAEECFAKAKNKAKDIAQLSIDLLNATSVEPGVYDIITAPSITGLIAHEAFGHGVEMDMFVKNRAKSRLYINKPVASKLVNMHDGAGAILSAASYFFDDDGVLAQDTLIIDKGILVNGISDVIAANELGKKPTGNSRRESPLRKAYSRMTNTFFEAGEDNLDDMIASIKHGYMLFQTDNGMEDPKNWNIQCIAAYGREIVDGKFTGKIISPVVMSGYVPDLLMSISMVSKDFEVIGSGHCGKGHKEWVPVSDGGPYLKARCKLS